MCEKQSFRTGNNLKGLVPCPVCGKHYCAPELGTCTTCRQKESKKRIGKVLKRKNAPPLSTSSPE